MKAKKMNIRRYILHIMAVFLLVQFLYLPVSQAGEVEGCAVAPSDFPNYEQGFDLGDFTALNTNTNDEGFMVLDTGQQAIDPNSIVVPFEQTVSVSFLFEGAGFTKTDFGWMLAKEGINGTKHEIFQNVNDNNDNGILDDRESAGIAANTVNLGTFAAGTELVFYLKVDDQNKVYYTKMAWNPDVWDGKRSESTGKCPGYSMVKKKWPNTPFTKIYNLGLPNTREGDCYVENGWLTQKALTRLKDIYGLAISEDSVYSMLITPGQKFPHVIVGAPKDAPDEWILGWEDYLNGNDTDHNDLAFRINRKSGGSAELKSEKAPVISDPNVYYTSVTISVFDSMPCSGKTTIDYKISVKGGEDGSWIPIYEWDQVRVSDRNKKTDGEDITGSWTYGSPQYTYRTATINLANKGYTGNQLVWKTQLTSEIETCVPEILDVKISGNVAKHGSFSRSSPVVQTNVLYSASYETPDGTWDEDERWLRGHLKATLLYDPVHPEETDPVTRKLWDAGEQLTAIRSTDDRNIYYPRIEKGSVANKKVLGDNSQIKGDGVAKLFVFGATDEVKKKYADEGRSDVKYYDVGKIEIDDGYHIMGGTLIITDGREQLKDKRSNILVGNADRTAGEFNRDTGVLYIFEFEKAPKANVAITASYSYYKSFSDVLPFTTTNVDMVTLGITKGDNIIGAGYENDFNGDNDVTEADADFLVEWVRGYMPNKNRKKEWLLGAIDHSTPAVDVPPGNTAWYATMGSDERAAYDTFKEAHKEDQTIVYAGSRDGMLHAFDGGQFRWGDNPSTTKITENRGYFEWTSNSANDDATKDESYTYGTGKELWAFIPDNLLSRLQNNLTGDGDMAYVDASPAIADIYDSGAWKAVVLFAQGNGGDTVVCLDVTTKLSPKLMWEFTDPDLEKSNASPSVARIGRIKNSGVTKWAVFFVSGKSDDTIDPSIFILDVTDGSLIERVYLTDADLLGAGKGGVPSGQPAVIDFDGNGYVDTLYIGTDKGYLFKVILPDTSGSSSIRVCAINKADADSDQQIYGSPSVFVERNDDGTPIRAQLFFGTGDSPYDSNDGSTATRYMFYGYSDTAGNNSCDPLDPDWFYQLPAGEKVWASAYASAGKIYFGTTTADTEDPCGGYTGGGTNGNTGNLYVIDLASAETSPGGQVSAPEAVIEVSGGVMTQPVVTDEHIYVKDPSGNVLSIGDATGGYNNAIKQVTTLIPGAGAPAVKAWREIY